MREGRGVTHIGIGLMLTHVILVDCSELSADEELALASRISDALEGLAVALVKGENIVLDQLSERRVDPTTIERIVKDFISRRKDADHYSVDVDGERLFVHSADPIAAKRKRRSQLPPNLKQCPYCSFVTPYEELYVVHVRAHLFGV